MAALKGNKNDKYIKQLANYAGLSYHSAKSLYNLMCADKSQGAQERLNGCMTGDEFCLAEAKEIYNYYGRLKLTVSCEVNPEAEHFEETVSDVALVIWAFRKIGHRERIQKAVQTAMSMFQEKKPSGQRNNLQGKKPKP